LTAHDPRVGGMADLTTLLLRAFDSHAAEPSAAPAPPHAD
jgi:hypothetical protein